MDGAVGERQLVKNAVAMLEIGFADLGQAEPARASVQQANTSAASSRETALLTLDFDVSRRRAAPEKLFALTTLAKISMSLISCMAMLYCFNNGNSFIQITGLIKRHWAVYHRFVGLGMSGCSFEPKKVEDAKRESSAERCGFCETDGHVNAS